MKKYISTAFLATALMISATCTAALQHNYNQNTQTYSVKSEQTISLDDDSNSLKIAFIKEYSLKSDKKNKTLPAPNYYLTMHVNGQKQYEFANVANYWQEHNFTYDEIAEKEAIEAELALLEKEKEADKALETAAKKNKQKLELSPEKQETQLKRAAREAELKEAHLKFEKTRKELRRNASTLIYLDVESKLSRTDESQPLYNFAKPNFNPDAEENPTEKEPENLMEKELQQVEEERQLKQEQEERELVAKLNADDPQAAAELRAKLEAESKIAKAEASEKKVNEAIASRTAMIEEVKATRAAFLKYQTEQKELMKDMQYTSTAKATLKGTDNFFKKVNNSILTNTPLFFEVIFWKGGPNQRLWLKADKLKELQELLNCDLAKIEASLKEIQ